MALERRRSPVLACLAALLIGPAASSFASVVRDRSFEATVRDASAIFTGRVLTADTRWGDTSRRWMETVYTLSVEDAILADDEVRTGATVTLVFWGGTIDGVSQAISDMPHPRVGEHLLLMLAPGWRVPGFSPVIGLHQGFFRVTEAEAGRTEVQDVFGRPLFAAADGRIGRSNELGTAATQPVELAGAVNALRASMARIKSMPASPVPPARVSSRRLPAKRPASAGDRAVELQPESDTFGIEGWALPRVDGIGSPGAGPGMHRAADAMPFSCPIQNGLSIRVNPQIVVNRFPNEWTWPDRDQMRKWNFYADVFRWAANPTPTYAWGDGIFDLDGWVANADLQEVYGRAWGASEAGLTFTRYSGGIIQEADIALNDAFEWTDWDEAVFEGTTYAVAFNQTMVHELGHMVGLDHDPNELSVMNYSPSGLRAYSFPYFSDAARMRQKYPAPSPSRTDLAVHFFNRGTQFGCFNAWAEATHSMSATPGQTFTFNGFTIANPGTATPEPYLEWYLTDQRHFDNLSFYLRLTDHPPVSPGTRSEPLTANLVLPEDAPGGEWFLAAFIRYDEGYFQGYFPWSNNFAWTRYRISLSTPTDDFASAGVLTGSSDSRKASNFAATREAAEPALGDRSVWWRWTAPYSGAATFQATINRLLAPGTVTPVVDPSLGVFTGSSVSALTTLALRADLGGASPVRIPVSAGTTYSIGTGSSVAFGSIRLALLLSPVLSNFDSDSRADFAVYHPASGLWFVRRSVDGSTYSLGFGGLAYTPVPRDYDGDGRADLAVYHAASGLWIIRNSSSATTSTIGYGGPGYTPVPADYDGDGRADIAVYHAESGLWFLRYSSYDETFHRGYGGPGYQPVPADYDGDGGTDVAVFHPASGLWFLSYSSTGETVTTGYGGPGYTPVPADYDGDGRADLSAYHAASGQWFARRSKDGDAVALVGGPTAVAVPADYNGDLRADFAVYEQTTGQWRVRHSPSDPVISFVYGGSGYVPAVR
jgi:hypothetical protein